jgi:hypothetical protein
MFGDQNLFCRQSDFERVGGYDQRLPIMEDLDLIMRLHAEGPSLDTDREAPRTHASASGNGPPSGELGRKQASWQICLCGTCRMHTRLVVHE